MKCNQKLVSFVARKFSHTQTHAERVTRDILFRNFRCIAFRKLRWQRTVNINNHNGVKFRCQIIETILNALQATIYSTTILHSYKDGER